MRARGWAAVLCLAWCALAAAVAGQRIAAGSAFDTDIQGLLPGRGLEPVVRSAMTEAADVAGRRVIVVVEAPEAATARAAAADLETALSQAGLVAADISAGQDLGRWVFANRNQLLCVGDPARFDAQAVIKRSLQLIYSPASPVSGKLLQTDPFLLTLQLATCLPPGGASRSETAGGMAMVSGVLQGSAYRLDLEDAVAKTYDAWRARWPGVQAARAGAVFYAKQGSAQARREVSLFSTLSGLGVLLCYVLCFRRPAAIVGALAVTATGVVGSLGATLLLFPAIHILVLVMGSALIGVTSDYALFYLATGPETGWADPSERVRDVLRPLVVCALSAALGFGSLALFGITLFAEVAVFAIAGVTTALLFTLTVLPLIDRRPRQAERYATWWRKLEQPLVSVRWGPAHAIAAGALLLVILAAGTARFRVLDDVHAFQPQSPALEKEEAHVRQAAGFSPSPSFLLSWGADGDQAREREEAALAPLPDAVLSDLFATSRLDPSRARRAANEATLRQKLYEPHLAERAALLGITDPKPFEPVEAASPAMLEQLHGRTPDGLSYLVAALGPTAAASVKSAGDGSLVVDPASRYSAVFAAYRGYAAWAVAAVLAALGLLVIAVYRTPGALMIMIGPAVGAAVAVALPAALGVPVSFFTMAALFVVMGAGLDYAVFKFEAARAGGRRVELAVFLAALMTVLTMGVLGLSVTYPVRSFGLAVAAGITAAYGASFAAGAAAWGRKRGE
jgi:predicted exporter